MAHILSMHGLAAADMSCLAQQLQLLQRSMAAGTVAVGKRHIGHSHKHQQYMQPQRVGLQHQQQPGRRPEGLQAPLLILLLGTADKVLHGEMRLLASLGGWAPV